MRSSEAAVEADDGRTTLLQASVARVSIRRPRLAYTRCNRSCCHVTREQQIPTLRRAGGPSSIVYRRDSA